VVVGGARVVEGASEADQEAVQHLIDRFEVDCGSLPPSAPLESSATASASAEATASQSAGAQTGTASCGDFRTMSGEPSQWQAQQYYDFAATPEEKAILDPDGDGFACEDLEPGAGGTDTEGGSSASPNPDDSSPDPGTPAPNGPSTAPPDSGGPVNCDGVNGPIPTPPGDPNNLDGDGDGEACE
jgi:micrococcal nuclease